MAQTDRALNPCLASGLGSVRPATTRKSCESLVMDILVKLCYLSQPPTRKELLGISGDSSCPDEVHVGKEIVGPNDWKPGAKTRKAVITKFSLRQPDENGANSPQVGLEFVAKTLTQEHDTDAQRELKALKKLQGHAHIIKYLTHVSIAGVISIAISPVACCDLSDLLSSISQNSSGNACAVPAQCRKHGCDVCFSETNRNIPLEDNPSLFTPLYADYECQIRALWSFFPYLCSALAWIHKNQYCHRDIKPDNILVEANGNVVIADFGSAETFDTLSQSHPPQSIRQLRGCAKKFLAPEVYHLETCHEAEADVFSLGVVFTEMLTLIAGKTISQYSEHRLGSLHGAPYWKQPVYACTLPEVSQWLHTLTEAIENLPELQGEVSGNKIHRQLVNIISLMIEHDRSHRLTAAEACSLFQNGLVLKCIDDTVVA